MIVLGGAKGQSRLVVGPEAGQTRPVNPMVHQLEDVHEIVGTGTLGARIMKGKPSLHMHTVVGRKDSTITGCVRAGVKDLAGGRGSSHSELLDSTATRQLEPALGFKLLEP